MKTKSAKPYVGAHVHSVSTDRLGTIQEIYTDPDGLTRARVRYFNGEAWDWNPPLSLLETV